LYPAITKVIQAAGRLIRTPTDRGVIELIDDRYRDTKIRKLLPAWWRVESGAKLRLMEGVAPKGAAGPNKPQA
jgi:Rad3-related DNA helicase